MYRMPGGLLRSSGGLHRRLPNRLLWRHIPRAWFQLCFGCVVGWVPHHYNYDYHSRTDWALLYRGCVLQPLSGGLCYSRGNLDCWNMRRRLRLPSSWSLINQLH